MWRRSNFLLGFARRTIGQMAEWQAKATTIVVSLGRSHVQDKDACSLRHECNETYDIAIQRGHVAASDVCAIDGDASMRIQIEHVS